MRPDPTAEITLIPQLYVLGKYPLLYMLRQKFVGSPVATRAALSLFASKLPLICPPTWLKQVAIYLQIKASVAQKLLGRNG